MAAAGIDADAIVAAVNDACRCTGGGPLDGERRSSSSASRGSRVWLDNIRRQLVTSGRAGERLRAEGVTGVTSNPTIFEKAVAEGPTTTTQIRDCGVGDRRSRWTCSGSWWSRTSRPRPTSCRPVHERTSGADGYVSIEVPPSLSHDTDATIAIARTLWERADRPN